MINLGYACICKTLSDLPKSKRITTNRSMIKRTFKAKGIKYASELSLANVRDLKKIIQWNEDHNIKFYRFSSDIFPWASEYEVEDFPDFEKIAQTMEAAGDLANKYGQRLTTHPGPFNKLASPKERVVLATIKDLEVQGRMMDLLKQPRSPRAKINIHVGAAYNDKPMALGNFNRNFERLSDAVKTRLTVENDDRKSLYSTHELYKGVYKEIGIPIVFDYHHHKFRNDGETEEEALRLAVSTWNNITPVVHYSQSRSVEHNDSKIRENAHSDSYWEPVNTYGLDLDVVLECKHKELGLFKMRELLT
jgi:UV DNA damage endonuclease